MNKGSAPNREQGMALVVVLWAVAALALLVTSFNSAVRGSARVLSSEVVDAKREAALSAGVELAVARLLAVGRDDAWFPDGVEHMTAFGGQTLAISITDANGLIDINKADGALLLGLLRQFANSEPEAEQARDRILDWRDGDSDAGFRGAEDFHYQRAGLLRGAGDTEFIDVTQLRDILEFPPDLYRRVLPYLTVYGSTGRINQKVAPREVLASMRGARQSGLPVENRTDRNEPPSPSPGQDTPAGLANPAGLEKAGALIIRVGIDDNSDAKTFALQVVIMLEADSQAPYRILSWGMVEALPMRSGVAP